MRSPSALFLLTSAAFAVADGADQSWEVRSTLEIIRISETLVLQEMVKLSDPALTASTVERLRRDSPPGAFEKVTTLMTAAPEGRSGSARETERIQHGHHDLAGDPRIWPAKRVPQPEPVAYPFLGFTSQEVGKHLVFTSRVSPGGGSVFLDYTCRSREFEDRVRFETGLFKGARLFVEKPLFSHRVSRGTTAIASGQSRLIGSYKLNGPRPMWELHILGAIARQVAVPTPPASPHTDADMAVDPDARPKPLPNKHALTLDVLRFHVPKNEALAARAQLLNDSHRDQVIEELLIHAAQGRAQLKDWQTLQTIGNDEQVDSDCIVEITYPTEPWNRAGFSGLPVNFATIMKWPRPPMDPPMTFETRNAGIRCEAHASVAEDGQTFDLHYNLESVDHTGFYRWPSGPDATGKVSFAFLPHFNSRGLVSSITMASGKPMLLGFHKLPGDVDRFELNIIRGTVRSLPANT